MGPLKGGRRLNSSTEYSRAAKREASLETIAFVARRLKETGVAVWVFAAVV